MIGITNMAYLAGFGDSRANWPDPGIASPFSLDDFDPTVYLKKKGLINKTRSTLFALSACQLMFQNSDPFSPDLKRDAVGLCFASNAGSLGSLQSYIETSLNEGYRATTPMQFPMHMVNAAAAHVAIWFNIQGFNVTLSSGISAGLDVFDYCSLFLEQRRCAKIIAGATEEISDTCHNMMESIACLKESKVKLGEGAGVVVLEYGEKLSDFQNLIAEVKGYGHAFCPEMNEEKTVYSAIQSKNSALENAGVLPGDVDVVFLNENGYPLTDKAERVALDMIFPESTRRVNLKQVFGECYSASGMLQVIGACNLAGKKLSKEVINKI
ncbi:MAG: beta-ketoacyl synthase N-terminal-like domain-containing protein, partial [Syntrophorhabdus sp.]